MIGIRLAHYEVTALLGKGGMGEVYRATDTKLGRDVAVKTLPADFANDPERLARFEREARTLASLQHANIASVYGFEEAEGHRFMVMELVEGEDLAKRLERSTLPVGEALDLARRMATGLQAAHEKGIIHRDLKPANVKITLEGDVKILDFGLARGYRDEADTSVSDDDSPTIDVAMTRAGIVLGTTAYMSPEQARGKALDKRADVWAFGCVLYEMLTGIRCFAGDTVTDVIAGIVTREPDWSLLPADLPPGGRELLQQTLEKDPRRRLRDMGDIGLLIDRVRGDLGRPAAVKKPGRGSSRPWAWAAVGLILGAIAIGLATRPWIDRKGPENLLAGATFTRMTDFAGSEFGAAISRDGQNIAFVADRGGQNNLWMVPVGTGQPVNLTRGSVPGLVSLLRSVGFSHDGSELWITGTMDDRLRRMPLVGGDVRNWLESRAKQVSWSPDGRKVVYHTDEAGDPLIVSDPNGSNRREILKADPGFHQHFPTWANDGWIYFVRGWENTGKTDLWRVRPDGTGSEPLNSGTSMPVHPTPIDAKTLLFVAREHNGAGPWLWAFDLESRTSRRLSYGLEHYTSVAASANGRRLVTSVANPRAGLWQIPLRNSLVTESDVEPVELPTVRALAPRFGPEDLYYLSSRGSSDGLWRFRGGMSQEIWKGSDAPLLQPAAISRDGGSIAFVLRKNDRNVLHVLSADGAELRMLTDAVDVHRGVSWSPDGAWIAAGGEDEDDRPGLFKISVNGNVVERIADGQAINPSWSPAGDLIIYAGPQVSAFSRILGVRPDGTPVELPPIENIVRGETVRFLPDGQALVHLKAKENFSPDFWLLDLTTMQDRRLTELEDIGVIHSFDIAPDGSRIVFDRLLDNSDIVLIDLEDR